MVLLVGGQGTGLFIKEVKLYSSIEGVCHHPLPQIAT